MSPPRTSCLVLSSEDSFLLLIKLKRSKENKFLFSQYICLTSVPFLQGARSFLILFYFIVFLTEISNYIICAFERT